MSLPLIPADRAQHVIYGAIGYVVCAAIATMCRAPQYAQHAGLAGALLLGICKEIADAILNERARRDGKPAPHGVQFGDVVATAIGGILCQAAVLATSRGGFQ